MKKILIIFIIVLSCFTAKSIHYFGSEITCKQLNGLTYHLTYKFYGEFYNGWNWPNEMHMIIKNNSTGSSFNVNAMRISEKELNVGVYELNYSAILTFPAPGEYTISQGTCCWTHSFNVINSSGQTYYNQCLITVDTVVGNSSPVFLYDPIVLATVNDTLFYNPLPYDEDGDELLWSIDTPRTNNNAELNNYSTPLGSSGLNFAINQKTGEITWKPNAIGQYIASVRVEEFRNGIKIGEVVRDMLFVVKSISGNSSRAIIDTDIWNVDPSGNFVFYLNYNTPFHLQFITNDTNADSLFIEGKGIPFLLQNNPALFLTSVGAGVSVSDFFWTPTFSDIKTDPYLVVFRIHEKGSITTLLRDRTIQFVVGNFTSVHENNEIFPIGNIYPVPTSGEFYIPVIVDKISELQISFVNQLGQEVKSIDKKLNTGQNLLFFNELNLPAGIYFLNLTIDRERQMRKLVIE
jgi:hypothetical protein